MGSFERHLLNSATEGAAGSGSALGAQLLAKMNDGKADQKITHEALRGAMGISSPETRAPASKPVNKEGVDENKIAIKEEMSDFKKIKDRTQKDLSRIEADRAAITNEIREIEARIKEATEAGHENIAKNWKTRLKKAVDVLGMIEKTSPTIKSFSDEAILVELKNYRHARHQQEQAELRVNKGEDLKAQGDYSRARNEAFAIGQKIEDLLKTKKESAVPENSSPAQTDSVIFSAEDALAEKKEHERTHTTPQEAQEEMSSFSLPEVPAASAPEAHAPAETEAPELNFVDEIQTPAQKNDEVLEVNPTDKANTAETQKTYWGLPKISTEKVAEIHAINEKTREGALPFLKEEIVVSDVWLSPEVKVKLNPEQLAIFEKIEEKFAKAQKPVNERVEKSGGWVLNKVRSAGEMYNKLPKHYKLLFAGGLFLSGAGAALAGSAVFGGAVVSLATASRALAGAGAFAGLEEVMRKSHERKTGAPITEEAAARQTILAGTLAVLIGSMLPTAMHNVLDFTEPVKGIVVTGKITTPILFPDEVTEVSRAAHNKGLLDLEQAIKEGNPETIRLTEETLGLTHEEALKSINEQKLAAPSTTETPPDTSLEEQARHIETAEPGDSVWKMAERQLETQYGEKFTKLPIEKQAYLINAVKERVAQHPASFGMVDANKLAIGQSIDFGQILNDKEFMDEQFADIEKISEPTVKELTETIITGSEPTTLPENGEMPKEYTATEEMGIKSPTSETEVIVEKVAPIEQTQTIAPDTNKTPAAGALETHRPPKMIPEIAAHPEILTQANEQVRDIIKEVFGSKGGFLGLGADDGTKIFSGFADKTVDEVTKMDTLSTEAPVENTSKLRDLLAQARAKTGVTAMPRETVGDYLHRAVATAISNSKIPK